MMGTGQLIRLMSLCQQISQKYAHLPDFLKKQEVLLPAAKASLDDALPPIMASG